MKEKNNLMDNTIDMMGLISGRVNSKMCWIILVFLLCIRYLKQANEKNNNKV